MVIDTWYKHIEISKRCFKILIFIHKKSYTNITYIAVKQIEIIDMKKYEKVNVCVIPLGKHDLPHGD